MFFSIANFRNLWALFQFLPEFFLQNLPIRKTPTKIMVSHQMEIVRIQCQILHVCPAAKVNGPYLLARAFISLIFIWQ